MSHWLLLRGLSREQRHWGGFPEALKRALPGVQVQALDLPGFGTEHDRASPASVPEIVEDLRARFQRLPLRDTSWNVIGISAGGMIALHWADRYPEDFKKLVLINSSAKGLSSVFRRLSLKALIEFGRISFASTPEEREKRILSLTVSKSSVIDECLPRAAAWAAERPMNFQAAIRQLWAASRFTPPKRISHPLLVISSQADRLCHPSCSENIARHYQAAHDRHPSAGHDLPLEEPDWLADRIRAWTQTQITS